MNESFLHQSGCIKQFKESFEHINWVAGPIWKENMRTSNRIIINFIISSPPKKKKSSRKNQKSSLQT